MPEQMRIVPEGLDKEEYKQTRLLAPPSMDASRVRVLSIGHCAVIGVVTMRSNVLKGLLVVVGLSPVGSSAMASGVEWILATRTSCIRVCENPSVPGRRALTSGQYTGAGRGFFTVCSANAHNEGWRSGFNLEPNWADHCYVAHRVEEKYETYYCACVVP